MTIKELLKNGTTILKGNDFVDSNVISKQLLCKTLNKNNQYILVHQEEEIDELSCKRFGEYIDEIVNGKPLQYITNSQEFMGYDFFVNESVLIPQPDTEIIVQACINICSDLLITKKKIRILDLCTGSGAIAISLDKILNKDNNIDIYASDISQAALEVARFNNEKLLANVKFIQSDMFDNIKDKYDIIISNPPYIATNIINSLPKDVQSEPHLALDGGVNGLKFYQIIEKEGISHLDVGGYLCLEIGYDQAKEVKEIFDKNYEKIRVIKDLGNNDRCIIATTK